MLYILYIYICYTLKIYYTYMYIYIYINDITTMFPKEASLVPVSWQILDPWGKISQYFAGWWYTYPSETYDSIGMIMTQRMEK